MAVERALVELVRKPWGRTDLRPWSDIAHDAVQIGEVWFQRTDKIAPDSALLLKLLFTTQPLSIQVHPDDIFAQSLGLANGKSEAWYILSAEPGAEVALGFKHPISSAELRTAIAEGSIADQMRWHPVQKGDVYSVPAGTVHAIGAGIVLIEIQQRSDATFRMFDYDRQRELHVENALAVAHTNLGPEQTPPAILSDSRTALITNRHFVLEKISLPPGSRWALHAGRETWMLVLGGGAHVGVIDVSKGDAMFVQDDRVGIDAGPQGLDGLLAYTGPDPEPDLLQKLDNTTILSGTLRASGEPPENARKQPEVS